MHTLKLPIRINKARCALVVSSQINHLCRQHTCARRCGVVQAFRKRQNVHNASINKRPPCARLCCLQVSPWVFASLSYVSFAPSSIVQHSIRLLILVCSKTLQVNMFRACRSRSLAQNVLSWLNSRSDNAGSIFSFSPPFHNCSVFVGISSYILDRFSMFLARSALSNSVEMGVPQLICCTFIMLTAESPDPESFPVCFKGSAYPLLECADRSVCACKGGSLDPVSRLPFLKVDCFGGGVKLKNPNR